MPPQPTSVLITGIAGFCGSYLAELLLDNCCQVAGLEIKGANLYNLSNVLDRVELHQADLRDVDQVRRLVSEVHPDRIYHLAALTKSPVERGWQALYEVNVLGTIHLLEAVRSVGLNCRLLLVGSSAQYGLVAPDENPIDETQPFRPVNHYAVTKAMQDLLGYRYWAANGLHVVRTRAFNIVGPRQSPQFAASAFARQLVKIEQGKQLPVLEVGNLESERDFVDVRDVVRAYWLALERGEAGQVYNVCSGQARRIRSVLEELLAHCQVQGIKIRQAPARMQPSDVPMQVGDFKALKRQTGWQPEIPFRQTMQDLLDYWRKQKEEMD